jgi:beta-lactamase class C
MVATLADGGKLSLHDPVHKYSASLRLPNGGEQRATINDLLSHRLGIFSHAQDPLLEDGADPKMLRGTLASLNLICAPGDCHSYQNVAYDAASELVEKVSGKAYGEVVRDKLFGPLGMRSATTTREGLVTASSWARPHRGGKGSRSVQVADPYYRIPAAGGVNSSVKDLAIWMQAQMGEFPDTVSADALAGQISRAGEAHQLRAWLADLRLCRPQGGGPSWRSVGLPFARSVRSCQEKRGRGAVEFARGPAVRHRI